MPAINWALLEKSFQTLFKSIASKVCKLSYDELRRRKTREAAPTGPNFLHMRGITTQKSNETFLQMK